MLHKVGERAPCGAVRRLQPRKRISTSGGVGEHHVELHEDASGTPHDTSAGDPRTFLLDERVRARELADGGQAALVAAQIRVGLRGSGRRAVDDARAPWLGGRVVHLRSGQRASRRRLLSGYLTRLDRRSDSLSSRRRRWPGIY